jgi:hypothetical protein
METMEHYQLNDGENMSALGLIITRAAQENIPTRVISRVLGYSEQKLLRYLQSALSEGRIPQMPPDDWPHLGGINKTLPSREMIHYGHCDVDVADACHEFGLTIGEGCLLMCLVKRAGKFCDIETLLRAISRTPEEVVSNLVQIRVCLVRQKLKPHGVRIITKRFCGYMMPVSAAEIVISLIATKRQRNMERSS